MNAIIRFLQEEEGLTAVEYAVAGALVTAAVVGAFATLGSDKYNDRLSVIGTFALQGQEESRDGQKLTYGGTWPIDSPIIEGKRVIPAGNGRITKFELYMDGSGEIIRAPVATVVASGFEKRYEIPCLVGDEVGAVFETEFKIIKLTTI